MLFFDFDHVERGEYVLLDGRNDVVGVVYALYELITGDTGFLQISPWERQMSTVMDRADWPCNREPDTDVPTFRKVLSDWVMTRQRDDDKERNFSATNRLTGPNTPTIPDYEVPYESLGRMITGHRMRRQAMELGQYCFRWERPSQRLLMKMKAEGEKQKEAKLEGENLVHSEGAIDESG